MRAFVAIFLWLQSVIQPQIQAHNTEGEAFRIANDGEFGLSDTVLSQNAERAYVTVLSFGQSRLASMGLILRFTPALADIATWGAEREGGPEGLEAFLETTAILMPKRREGAAGRAAT